jgi:hypothetical protein
MNVKQILAIAALLIIAGAAWWLWTQGPSMPEAIVAEHVLRGTVNEDRNYVYTEKMPYYTVEAEWPEKVPLPTAEASAKAGLTIEKGLKERIDEFKKNGNFENLTDEDVRIQGLGEGRTYALTMEYTDYVWEGGHSYAYTVYEDTLGAHPNVYYVTFVFDLEGNQVKLENILASNPNWLEELSLLVSNDVSAQYRTRTGADDLTGLLYPEGLAPDSKNFQNWVVHGDDLLILIPPYQVAAYAVGTFEVRIPLANLR